MNDPTGYTKHIYSGNERIVSKIGTGGLSRIHNHIKQQAEWQPKQELSKLQLKRTMPNGINRPVEGSDITGNSLNHSVKIEKNVYLMQFF